MANPCRIDCPPIGKFCEDPGSCAGIVIAIIVAVVVLGVIAAVLCNKDGRGGPDSGVLTDEFDSRVLKSSPTEVVEVESGGNDGVRA